MEQAADLKAKLTRKIELPKAGEITKYQLRHTLILSLVPLFCGLLLLMLLSVFAKLNLYFLEAHGLVLDNQVRDAYFKQVELEMFGVVGYLVLQVLVTGVVSYTVMRWATSPFTNAERMIRKAMHKPEELKPASRWLSESPVFDRIIWLFALRVKGGGENQVKTMIPLFGTNLPFLAKFLAAFGILSVSTGYVLSIIMGSVYQRIVELALHLLKSTKATSYYFLAQQEMLQDATELTIGIALIIYFLLGLQISRYMATMLFVFSRSIYEDSFPLTLRSSDLYTGLADAMNEARAKVR